MSPERLPDETIAAFVDGALDPGAAARVVIHLADHPVDRARADALFEANRLLALAFDAPMREPVPERIRRVIEAGPVSGGAARFAPRRAFAAAAGAAVAASVALILGVGGFGPGGAPDATLAAGPVDPASAIHVALESAPGGTARPLGEDATVVMVATFRDSLGRFCREAEIAGRGRAGVERALACRGDGRWIVEAVAVEPRRAAGDSPGFAPASGAARPSAVETALNRLGAGVALDAEAESAALSAGWPER